MNYFFENIYQHKNLEDSTEKYYDNNITTKVWNFFKSEIPKIGYESREGQEDMALDICDAIKDNEHIMIEAGVGIGKTYAYLVPLLYFNLLTNSPVIISTSTILLQEQLINDIKIICKRTHLYPEIVLAKGMTHFKCIKRALKYLEKHNCDGILSEWIENTSVGDKSNLPEQIEDSLWNKLNVKNCDYKNCDMYKQCYYIKRREKMINTSGIILCNHDLLAVDLKRKENYGRNILSSAVKLVVIDEAHNLEEKVRNSLKESYKFSEIKYCIDEAILYLRRNKTNMEIDNNCFNDLIIIYNNFLEQTKHQKKTTNNVEGDIERFFLEINSIKLQINNFIELLDNLNVKVQLTNSELYDDKQDLIIGNLENLLRLFKELSSDNCNSLFWIELENNKLDIKNIKIIKCLKNINKEIYNMYFKNNEFKTILTSATLTSSSFGEDELKYKYIVDTLGFPLKEKAVLATPKQSPYDYNKNSIIYYKEDMPHPTKERNLFINKSIEVISKLINLTQGKTMILFTAKSDMDEVYKRLKNINLKWKIIKQENERTQNSIIKEFKEDENSVLLGTGSYWEGINIEGKALSSLIIFRLPFPVPDPVIDYKRTMSDNPLMEIDVPEMIIKLKQGVGRLIRNATDKGIVTILDPRINTKSSSPYKDLVWNSLPMKIKTNDINIISDFIEKNKINKLH